MPYFKIEFKTHSMFVYSAIASIANKSNIVKRKITMDYNLVINTKKDHLFDDLIKALESKGYHSPADFTLTSTPYERKAPKKSKTKRTPKG